MTDKKPEFIREVWENYKLEKLKKYSKNLQDEFEEAFFSGACVCFECFNRIGQEGSSEEEANALQKVMLQALDAELEEFGKKQDRKYMPKGAKH